MYIHGRGNTGYLTRDKMALNEKDPTYALWDQLHALCHDEGTLGQHQPHVFKFGKSVPCI